MQSMRNVDVPSNIKVFDEIGGDGSENRSLRYGVRISQSLHLLG